MLAKKLLSVISTPFVKATLSRTFEALRSAPSTQVTSSSFTVTGPQSYTVSASEGVQFSINSGPWVTSGVISNGGTIVARLTSQASVNQTVFYYVSVGDPTTFFQLSVNTDTYYVGGSAEFKVPFGVTSMSMLVVGGGGASNNYAVSNNMNAGGGGGGALAYRNNVPVTPGETLSLTGGASGNYFNIPTATNGGNSSVKRGSTILVLATGGKTAPWQSDAGTPGLGGAASGCIGDVKFSGGNGAQGAIGTYASDGGYCARTNANGANGASRTTTTTYGRSGGNVLFNGSAGTITYNFDQLFFTSNFGAGGASRRDGTAGGNNCPGGPGTVVLVWGGRTFSSSTSF